MSFPMKVEIKAGTLDIINYNFEENEFIGSNKKKYSINEINYFIISREEMKKILGIKNDNDEVLVKSSRSRNYSK